MHFITAVTVICHKCNVSHVVHVTNVAINLKCNESHSAMFNVSRVYYVSPNKILQFQHIQSTLVISKSKGPSKTVRDIRTLTYQICSIEEKTI